MIFSTLKVRLAVFCRASTLLRAGLLLATAIPAMPARADDVGDVRATVEREGKLFDTRDVALAAKVFTPDVVWQNPFGVRCHGRAELERFLTHLFKQPGYLAGKTVSKPVFTDIRLLGASAAVAWETDTSKGETDDTTGKPIGVRKSHVMYALQKRNGIWLITDELIMDEHLR